MGEGRGGGCWRDGGLLFTLDICRVRIRRLFPEPLKLVNVPPGDGLALDALVQLSVPLHRINAEAFAGCQGQDFHAFQHASPQPRELGHDEGITRLQLFQHLRSGDAQTH